MVDNDTEPDERRSDDMATTTATQMMTAIVQRGYGRPARVLAPARVARPVPGDDQVLIRVRATSVNTPDWIMTTGIPYILRLRSGLRRPKAPIRGTDVAGVVEAVGDAVTGVAPGDEVFGSSWANDMVASSGSFAEYAAAPATQVLAKPAGLSFAQAAAAVMSGVTALVAMRDVGRVGPGIRVLVNGASGGVGTFAVQIAKAFGAHVTGVCSTRNVALVRDLGADAVIDYTARDFTREAARFDVILDNAMNHRPSVTTRVLAPGGVFIPNSVGDAGGLLAGLPRMAQAALLGRGPTRVQFARCVVDQANLAAVADLLVSGAVTTVIDRTYPLEDAAGAVAHMLTHRARGNIAIVVGDDGH
jgi:NADPH:quinone reductase-like Zn-dependent oxidoreductase